MIESLTVNEPKIPKNTIPWKNNNPREKINQLKKLTGWLDGTEMSLGNNPGIAAIQD